MKKEAYLLVLLIVVLLFATIDVAWAQEVMEESAAAESKVGFFTTFVRTPFALFTVMGTFMGGFFTLVFEFLYNIFCGFKCGYPVTKEIWEMGWNSIIVDWWWKPGKTWQLIVCIILWSGTVFGTRKKK